MTCGIGFRSKKICRSRTPKYCSKVCYAESLKVYKICPTCNIRFANYKNKRFCGSSCRIQYSIDNKQPIKERAAKYRHKRRSLIAKEADVWFLERLLIAQRHRCFYCEGVLTYRAVDHTVPVSRGGDNDSYNLVWSCKSCNSRKRDKTLEEYAVITGNLYWLDKADMMFVSAL